VASAPGCVVPRESWWSPRSPASLRRMREVRVGVLWRRRLRACDGRQPTDDAVVDLSSLARCGAVTRADDVSWPPRLPAARPRVRAQESVGPITCTGRRPTTRTARLVRLVAAAARCDAGSHAPLVGGPPRRLIQASRRAHTFAAQPVPTTTEAAATEVPATFINTHNTCYAAALLRCLAAVRPLTSFLLEIAPTVRRRSSDAPRSRGRTSASVSPRTLAPRAVRRPLRSTLRRARRLLSAAASLKPARCAARYSSWWRCGRRRLVAASRLRCALMAFSAIL